MDSQCADTVCRLGAFQHIEREKAVDEFSKIVTGDGFLEQWPAVKQELLQMLSDPEWEKRLGALLGAKVAVPAVDDPEFGQAIERWAMDNLEEREVRVRLAIAQVLGILASKLGTPVWERCGPVIMQSITSNFERDAAATVEAEDDRDLPGSPALGGGTGAAPPSLMGALLSAAYEAAKPGVGNLRHGTEGWKALETSVQCAHEVMAGTGVAFAPHATPEVRALLRRCFSHMNRFVRETGYLAMAALCTALSGTDALEQIAEEVASDLVDGLSDNWSQVRYAASRAARALLLGVTAAREAVYPIVMPAMCLNRYYVAEGVRLYSQETWRLVMGTSGREVVARYIDSVVPYYVSQSKANNHAVREAACGCMTELMNKVERTAVEGHVQTMLQALLNCFKDESWPVRDCACTACASAVANFPEAAAPKLDDLYGLWFDHLWDNIYSVRENSAIALGVVAGTLREGTVARMRAWLSERLLMAKEQTAQSSKFGELENVTQFGVAAKRARDNNIAAHTDQTMFSCGSLAPKLKRSGGCMDDCFTRPKEPWEATDGGVYLLRELAAVDAEAAVPFLEPLAEVGRMRHFEHSDNLRETLWNCLPLIAQRMGKRLFKPHLELFLEAMFRDLTCGHQLCECAAGKCVAAFRDWLGSTIFAGRLDDWQLREMAANENVPPPAPAQCRPADLKQGTGMGSLASRMKDLPEGSAIPNLLGK